METLTIGRLAKKVNVNIETIRYYERRGLMPEPTRSESNYRHYTQDSVARIRFIIHAKELGFSLKQVKIDEIMQVINKTGYKAIDYEFKESK